MYPPQGLRQETYGDYGVFLLYFVVEIEAKTYSIKN